MVLLKKYLGLLACPKRHCRGELSLAGENFLACKECGDQYRIIDGIPILYPNDKYSKETHARHWDMEKNAASYAKKYNSYLKKEGNAWGRYTHVSEIEAVKKLTEGVDLTGKTILDLGCGNGRLLSLYPEAGLKIGLDTSLMLLQAAKKREPDFLFVCAQMEDLPFRDCVADFSVSVRVFQHIRVPKEAFSEMVRATKPSGQVALEIYNKFNLKELYKRLRMLKWMDRIKPWGLEYDRYYSFLEIEKWYRENFVRIAKYAGAGWGIHFYLFELVMFRRFVPEKLQKIAYNIFLGLERVVGTWPFFSKTMEKVCVIGSLQGKSSTGIIPRALDKLENRSNLKRAINFQELIQNRNYCFTSTDREHLALSLGWIKKAQDATADSGVSRGWSPIRNIKTNHKGWQPSYPETTGYIIPTFIRASKVLGDRDFLRRASLMADWEINIMYPNGAVHGGNITAKPNQAVFDTGQVIRGFIALFNETKNEKYLQAAEKSAGWMLMNENGKEGQWVENNAACVNPDSTTYNTFAAAPVAQLGKIINNEEFLGLGRRVGLFALSKQNQCNWFDGADFRARSDALLHTIAYTIDGLWDLGDILEENKFSESARLAIDGVLSRMDERGSIPGRLNGKWESQADWACLTGIAQTAVTSMKIYEKTGMSGYLEAARKAKEFLKSCQNNIDESYGGGKGAVWGSWPISGEYGKYEALNWPVKFFADLLLEFVLKENKKNE